MEFTQFLYLFKNKHKNCAIKNMARPTKPKTPLAQRLIDFRGGRSRDDFARSIDVIPGTYANYERGDAEPNANVLASLVRVHGMNLHWLFTGSGFELAADQPSTEMADNSAVRKLIWNIAKTYWEQVPGDVEPTAVADQFLETFDFLLSRTEMTEDTASEVIQFGAERLKKAPGND